MGTPPRPPVSPGDVPSSEPARELSGGSASGAASAPSAAPSPASPPAPAAVPPLDLWLADETLSEVCVLEEEYVAQAGPFDAAYLAARAVIVDDAERSWRGALQALAENAPDAARAADPFEANLATRTHLPSVAPFIPPDGQSHPIAQLTAGACQARDERLLAHFYQHAGARRTPPRWALCFSGGGIRSATFALGVTQALARDGLLSRFHYLSTVSGGGYIGSWLQAWIHRHPAGLDGVTRDLQEARGAPAEPDPPAVHRLREYSSYLAPRFGALSADTWTLAGIYLRNLLINWTVFIPLLAGLLAVPRLAVAIMASDPSPRLAAGAFWVGLSGLVIALAVTGVSMPTGRSRRPHLLLAQTQTQFLWKCLLPLAVSGLLLSAFWAWVSRNGALAAAAFDRVSAWPGLLAPVRLVESWDWARPSAPFTFEDYWLWIYTGALMHAVAWALCLAVLAQRGELYVHTSRAGRAWGLLRDLGLVLAAGGLGGGLVYSVATQLGAPLLHGTGNVADFPFYVVVAPPLFWMLFLLAGTFYVAVRSYDSNDQEREWYARGGAWVLIVIITWTVVTTLIIFGPTVLLELYAWSAAAVTSVGVGTALFTILGGGSASSAGRRLSGEKDAGWREWLIDRGLALAAPLLLVLIVILLSWSTSALLQAAWERVAALRDIWTYDFRSLRAYADQADVRLMGWQLTDRGTHLGVLMSTHPVVAAGIVAGLLLICAANSLVMNLNVFSLHGMYRDRLIRAFLAASRLARRPNPLTGFDAHDNLPLHHLQPDMFTLQDAPPLVLALRQLGSDPVDDCVRTQVHDRLPIELQARIRSLVQPTEVDWELGEPVVGAFNDLLTLPALARAAAAAGASGPPAGPAADPAVDAAGGTPAAPAGLAAWNRTLLDTRFPALAAARAARAAVPRAAGLPRRPLCPLINTALNLTSGDDLAWQERKAESFVFTPSHVGGGRVGFRRLQWNAGDCDRRYGGPDGGVSLGTAITISGAAANPNMGHHSSPVITFLLTLFNARLGSWLGNPRDSGAAARSCPRLSALPIVSEAIGFTNERRSYVNLSDGGHFENLGLYEAIRRRCRIVLVVDAGQDVDFTFGDLGNAVSKVRVDFGVPIEFVRPPAMHRQDDRRAKQSSRHAAIARIRYSCVDPRTRDGWLLYVKPVIDGREPADVAHYARAHRDFPHQPTLDQFFTESQFESYRALGRSSMIAILGEDPVTTAAGLIRRFHHVS